MEKTLQGKVLDEERTIRDRIRKNVSDFFELKRRDSKFTPIKDRIRYSGPVYDEKEVTQMMERILDGWFGVSSYSDEFEKNFSKIFGVSSSVLTNSGSSANLLAVSALCSNQVPNRLKPGDEVITPACTFSTTFNPIVQNSLTPVLLDVQPGTYNINPEQLREAFSRKTRAIMLPHTLGNPNDMDAVMDFVKEHDLFLVEDVADALGSSFGGKKLGSFGNFGTFSFYASHQITLGEGGAVAVRDKRFEPIIRSLRNWGRGEGPFDDDWTKGTIIEGYDNRYLYVTIGYNLKPLEFQAAMGLEQLKRIDGFIKIRKKNFNALLEFFSSYEDQFILPESLPKADPCWFGFPLTLKKEAKFKRKDFLDWLEKHNIETRLLFAGNIIRHPAYREVVYRKVGNLENSDYNLKNSFFIGVYPGIDSERLNFMVDTLKKFLDKFN